MTLQNVSSEFAKLNSNRNVESIKQATNLVNTMKSELVARTPIDTGLARASWKVDRIGPVFNVRNTVPYIQYLNAGSSKQAPAYFIESIALKYGRPLGSIVEVVK
jgi:hypothetical protein